MFRTAAALLIILMGAPACAAREPVQVKGPAGITLPHTVYVMRHLQRGEGQDPGLTAEGTANAQRLATFFKADPPAAIYVSNTRRAQETAAPLAAALKITPKVYDARNTAGLIQSLSGEQRTVLVIGHSNTVHEIVGRLGGAAPAPLAETDYGDIFQVSGEARTVTRTKLGGS
jgi:broad specificity phosphatase PhoE